MDFTYLYQPPKRYTFEQPKLKLWVERFCTGRVLNLFAGRTLLNADELRVDTDTDMIADYYMDALSFVNNWDGYKFDTVILDPPYNWRKAKEKYGNRMIGNYPKLKNKLIKHISNNGKVISLGYDSVGMSKSRGFEKTAICLVCHSGDFRDTICVVETLKYVTMKLF